MKKISWRGWIVTYLTKILFWRFNSQYKKQHGNNIPTILIAGTVGKSSQTMLLADIFERAGWQVFTGAKKAQSLNSITGLSMVIGQMNIDFYGSKKKLAGLIFIYKTILTIFTLKISFQKNAIVIYETGIDSVNEAQLFDTVFAPVQPILVVTSVTAEHTGGFEKPFEPAEIVRMGGRLPADFLHIFTLKDVTDTEKNVALDQVKIHTNPSAVILPTSIKNITNTVVHTLDGNSRKQTFEAKRTNNFAILVDQKYTSNEEYLLPKTFAKTIGICSIIAKKYNISDEIIQESLQKIKWPNGRFSLFEGKNNTTLVDSTYNADPASMKAFFDLLEEVIQSYQNAFVMYQKVEEDKHLYRPGSHLRKSVAPVFPPKHTIILGEMRELGQDSAKYHLEIITQLLEIARKYPETIENIYLVGHEWKKIDDDVMPKSEQGMYFIHVDKQLFKGFEAIKYLQPLLDEKSIRPNNWIWLKGSQNTIYLEVLVQHLLANKEDAINLCRQGKQWDEARKNFVI